MHLIQFHLRPRVCLMSQHKVISFFLWCDNVRSTISWHDLELPGMICTLSCSTGPQYGLQHPSMTYSYPPGSTVAWRILQLPGGICYSCLAGSTVAWQDLQLPGGIYSFLMGSTVAWQDLQLPDWI